MSTAPSPPESEAAPTAGPSVLAINGGSSSLKFALFDESDPPRRRLSGKIERIGQPESPSTLRWPDGRVEKGSAEIADLAAAARWLIDRLGREADLGGIAAIGHRVVHGGPRYDRPQRIDEAMIAELRRIVPYDPDHLPGQIALINAFGQLDPDRVQVACFDTDFHRDLPQVARLLPIPRRFEAQGIRRYGFHGLSYTYLMEALARVAGPGPARGRVILAHLGSGASMAAVAGGTCLDTTMGLTPAAGLVMGTRSGDVDPGLCAILSHAEGMTADAFHEMTSHASGLLGISETSADFRDLLARAPADRRAAEAVAIFAYSVRKHIGAYAAALGGLDTLVFSGGIGENSAEARRMILAGMEFLGIRLDPAPNAANAPVISTPDSPVVVRVIPTDEEATIARLVRAVLRDNG